MITKKQTSCYIRFSLGGHFSVFVSEVYPDCYSISCSDANSFSNSTELFRIFHASSDSSFSIRVSNPVSNYRCFSKLHNALKKSIGRMSDRFVHSSYTSPEYMDWYIRTHLSATDFVNILWPIITSHRRYRLVHFEDKLSDMLWKLRARAAYEQMKDFI